MSEFLVEHSVEVLVVDDGADTLVVEPLVQSLEVSEVQVLIESSTDIELLEVDSVEVLFEGSVVTELLEIGVQGPPGPPGPSGTNSVLLTSRTNKDVVEMKPGHAVYAHDTAGVKLAIATTDPLCRVIGFATEQMVQDGSGSIQLDSYIELTIPQWEVVTGIAGPLVVNARYYLDGTTPGGITHVAPTAGWVCPVGIAITPTQLLIDIDTRIQL